MRMFRQVQAANQAISGFEPGTSQQAVFDRNWKKCYEADNNFAYKKDLFDAEPTEHNRRRMIEDVKMYNFAPTVDRWCLWCENKQDVKKICARCRHVFFCNVDCQRKAWGKHKAHCGRNVFAACITCGGEGEATIPCDGCPAKWCSEKCREQLIKAHKEFDCNQFRQLFVNK